MMRKLGGTLFAPVFFVAVMAMMLILRPDPSLTTSQITSINGVFLSEDWIEESTISQEIKDQTDRLPTVQRSVFMRRLADEEPLHVVHLSGREFADETGIERITGESYFDEEDPADHEDPYAKGLTTVTPDEDLLPQDEWEEYQGSDWSRFPSWIQGLEEEVHDHYGRSDAMDMTTIHPDEVERVIRYTWRVEEIRREEQDDIHQEEIDDAIEAGETPPAELDHGPLPHYSEITRDIRRMSPDVVLLDMHLIFDHMESNVFQVPTVTGVHADQDILEQTYEFLNDLYRGNVDHFTTYILFQNDIHDRFGPESSLVADLNNLVSQFSIYDDQQVVYLAEIDTYDTLRPAWWSTSQLSPLLTGE